MILISHFLRKRYNFPIKEYKIAVKSVINSACGLVVTVEKYSLTENGKKVLKYNLFRPTSIH